MALNRPKEKRRTAVLSQDSKSVDQRRTRSIVRRGKRRNEEKRLKKERKLESSQKHNGRRNLKIASECEKLSPRPGNQGKTARGGLDVKVTSY